MFGWADGFDWEAWAEWLIGKWWAFGIVGGLVALAYRIGNNLGGFFETWPEKIRDGMKLFLGWLVELAGPLISWLPDHVPLALPDPAVLTVVLAPLGMLGRFIDLPLVFGVLALGVGYATVRLLYAVYRAVLGFVPMFK